MEKVTQKTAAGNTSSILVIFGATGDLAAKKIIPSLWRLFQQGSLPDRLGVIGFARRDLSPAAFRTLVREAIEKGGGVGIGEDDFSRFFEFFSYHAGVFEQEDAFRDLAVRIAKTERAWGVCANKLFYLATPPSSYEQIFKNLAAAKLNIPCGGNAGWSRVLIEKPFGTDLASAKALQALLSSYFKEEQIYRIDHYLFKEIIQGIENFRFSNNLFEHTWDNTTIERIDVRLLESIGVEERGGFYDAVGALRDVGQNHLLTMLAAITMEYPPGMDAAALRENRARILETLAPWTEETIRDHTFRAQYNGYARIAGVRPNSHTETYFALQTELLHARWKGVRIIMEAGKRMAEARKEIVLTLRHPSACLLCETGPHAPNRIVFRLEPNDEIVIHFWTKKPGFERAIEERAFSFFLYEKETKAQYVEEYAKVLYAAMGGDQALFIAPEEVEASWKFTDPVVDGWRRGVVPLTAYEPDTTPSCALVRVALDTAHGRAGPRVGEIGMIGLGKMGANLARQLHEKKWKVIGFNETPDATRELESEGILSAYTLSDLVGALAEPRTIWLMVPHEVVDHVLDELVPLLTSGDMVIDGGNSFYEESVRRSKKLAEKDIGFLDVGVSGGPGGAKNGACLMVGGETVRYGQYEHLFKDLSVPGGYGYMGESGAGHFVKMVHNGIEYGMMQAIAEGFSLLKQSRYHPDLAKVAEVYNRGSVIQSRLIGWLKDAFTLHGEDLEDVSGSAAQTGEGLWTVRAAQELNLKTDVIEGAVQFRTQSQRNPSYTGKIISALREQFGGHEVKANKGKASN